MAGVLGSGDCAVTTFCKADMKACKDNTKLLFLWFLLSMF